MPTLKLLRLTCAVLLVSAGVCAAGPSRAADAADRKIFDVSGGDALASLKQFAQQSGVELLYSTKEIAGATTNAVKGDLTPREALARMLDGTELVATHGKTKGALAVTRAPDPNGHRAAQTTSGDRPAN